MCSELPSIFQNGCRASNIASSPSKDRIRGQRSSLWLTPASSKGRRLLPETDQRLCLLTRTWVAWSSRCGWHPRVCQSGLKISKDNNPGTATPPNPQCRLSWPAGSQDQAWNGQAGSKELKPPFQEPGGGRNCVPDPSYLVTDA